METKVKKRRKIQCRFETKDVIAIKHRNTLLPLNNMYYYQIRHDELDWTKPVTIEEVVVCNYLATMVTRKPQLIIDKTMKKDGYFNINKAEREFIEKMIEEGERE